MYLFYGYDQFYVFISFANITAVPKHITQFKSGQKRPKNNHLIYKTEYKSLANLIDSCFFNQNSKIKNILYSSKNSSLFCLLFSFFWFPDLWIFLGYGNNTNLIWIKCKKYQRLETLTVYKHCVQFWTYRVSTHQMIL